MIGKKIHHNPDVRNLDDHCAMCCIERLEAENAELRKRVQVAETIPDAMDVLQMENAALRRQLDSRRMNWQPIETAPKDGKAILVFGRNFIAPWIAYWQPNSDECDSKQPGWIDGSRNRYEEYVVMTTLTHWMPLPDPPKIDAAIASEKEKPRES